MPRTALLLLLLSWPGFQQPQKPIDPLLRREPAQVMDPSEAGWLTRPEREAEEQPEMLLDVLNIKPGDVVADVGAGVGYLSFRLAKRVGEKGRVLAQDLQQEMLDELIRKRDELGLKNVEPVLGTPIDPNLPANSVDLALLVDVYHEFSNPLEMMEGVRASLKPDGRLVLVEYRAEDPAIPIAPRHKMTERQVLAEIAPMGFRHLETLEILPRQHVIVFAKQIH